MSKPPAAIGRAIPGEAAEPAGPAPARRASSIRRTTTIETTWPGGLAEPMHMVARGRDLASDAHGAARPVSATEIVLIVSTAREILALRSDPPGVELTPLIGVRAGGASRKMLSAVLAGQEGSLAYTLLDDFPGASLVANWVRSRWPAGIARPTAGLRPVSDICLGFAHGSPTLTADGRANLRMQRDCPVGPLQRPDDPDGWHDMTEQRDVPGMRRARRTDLWREDDRLHLDIGFQDSGTDPDGGRRGIHEYTVRAQIDAARFTLVSIDVRPHILPFPQCPAAITNVTRLLGRDVRTFRAEVPQLLPGALGCTHLNDVLRSLADAPALVASLDRGATADVRR